MAESSLSGELWSDLYYLYFAIAAIVGALVVGWLFYNMWVFRYRPDRVRPLDAPLAGTIPVERGHPLWSYAMAGVIALIMFGLAFGTISAVNEIEIPPDCDTSATPCHFHDVIGYQFGWKYNYTGVGGIPFQVITPGADQFTVPVDTPIIVNVTSQDVWHNFAIPDFRLRVDAIPGTVNPIWFQATETGSFRNACVQICGVNHAKMHAPMQVVTKAEYDEWLAEQSDEAYDKLQNQIFRNPERGAVVNATFDGAAITLADENVLGGMPVVLNVTNQADREVVAFFGGNAATIPAGATQRLYAIAPETGQLEVVVGDARATLEVSE